MATVPQGAACYFCLEEGADEEGKTLVRNCSCRGDSGFAHLSCLKRYTEQKCRAVVDGKMSSFIEPWQTCDNCKQYFQGQLAAELIAEFVSFTEANYAHSGNSMWDKMKIMASRRLEIIEYANKLDHDRSEELVECKILVEKLLAMVDQTKKCLKMNGWIHMPKTSTEYQYYKMLCGDYEAFGYDVLGKIARLRTEEGINTMITHWKKARAVYNLVGNIDEAEHIDTKIALFTTDAAGISIVQNLKNSYDRHLSSKGISSEETIRVGLSYANTLWNTNCSIEAGRLVTKLDTVSRRVNGPDHNMTIKADEVLEQIKQRWFLKCRVVVLPEFQLFLAVRYKNDEAICVVQGPITNPRCEDDERIHRVESNLVVPADGCPVICHGLVSASHLNGVLGDTRDIKNTNTGIRCEVYLKNKSALIKPENLRVVFELPICSE